MKNIYKRTIEGCGFLTPLQQYFRYIVMIKCYWWRKPESPREYNRVAKYILASGVPDEGHYRNASFVLLDIYVFITGKL
jgi:hypothetical protein